MKARGWIALTVGVAAVAAALVAVDFVVKSTIEQQAASSVTSAVDQSLGSTGARANVTIHSFPVLADLARGEVTNITAVVTIPYSELADAAQNQVGDVVKITSVSPDSSTSDGVTVSGSMSVLGINVPVSASYAVDIQDRGATLTPTNASVLGGLGGEQVKDKLMQLLPTVSLTFDQLPAGASITHTEIAQQGIIATITVPSYML